MPELKLREIMGTHNVEIAEFSVTQILREIKFGAFSGPKTASLTQSEALNFNYYEFLHF